MGQLHLFSAAPHLIGLDLFTCTFGPYHCIKTQTAHAAPWDGFISSLRYGGIAVNVPIIFLFGQTALSWGAFPGNTPQVRILDDTRKVTYKMHQPGCMYILLTRWTIKSGLAVGLLCHTDTARATCRHVY